MALVDHFVDALGEPLLVPGPALDADNELFEPYVVHFDDVCAVLGGDCMAVGDRWVARMLSTRLRVPGLGELVFDMVSADDDEDVTTERRRSARRCRDTEGDPVVTGWLEVTL